MIKLKEPFRTNWIKALRSGDYEQCHGVLFYEGGFCCLGVGCHVSGIKEEDLFEVGMPHEINAKCFDEVDESFLHFLACANDDDGWDFNHIADYIEQNTEAL